MIRRDARSMAGFAGVLAGAVLAATPARAESCDQSRQYILDNALDELPLRPQAYRDLWKVCEATLSMTNVREAFILMTGAIAVIPVRDGVGATATTLAEFCMHFPKETLRFVAPKELSLTRNTGRAVRIDSSTATPCRKIVQGE